MNAIEAIKNDDLESIKLLLSNGEKFDKLSWADWQPLTNEVYDLFKEHKVEISFNNIMATQDKRVV